MSRTISDYHVVSDAPVTLSDGQGIIDFTFNPPNDIVLSGNQVHRPIMTFRVDPGSSGCNFTVRLPEENHTVGNFNLGGGTMRQVNEVIPFGSINKGQQAVAFDASDGNAKISDVVIWFKRKIP